MIAEQLDSNPPSWDDIQMLYQTQAPAWLQGIVWGYNDFKGASVIPLKTLVNFF
jgi:hypothetical protein